MYAQCMPGHMRSSAHLATSSALQTQPIWQIQRFCPGPSLGERKTTAYTPDMTGRKHLLLCILSQDLVVRISDWCQNALVIVRSRSFIHVTHTHTYTHTSQKKKNGAKRKKIALPGNRTRVARMGILHDATTPAVLIV